MKRLAILLYLCCQVSQAQDIKETIVQAPIQEVTVFLKGAQITLKYPRNAQVALE